MSEPTLATDSPTPQLSTQDEIDRNWLENVYKPNEPQLTTRAILAGMCLGGIMSISNLYIGMKIGWSMGMAIASTIMAFALFRGLRGAGLVKTEFSMLENNTVASAASAAGYYSSAGMVSAIPALFLTQQRVLSWWELSLWMTSVSFIGVVMAVPMRRQMIDVDRLPFPSGTACAEAIRSMHNSAGEALAKARSLLIGAIVAALIEIPSQIGAVTRRTGEVIFKNPLTWADQIHLPGKIAGKSLAAYMLSLPSSLLMYGAGAIMGIRVGVSLAVGALVLFGMIVPWLAAHGIVVVDENYMITYRSTLAWSVWPGVMAALAASLLQFAIKWRSIAQAFGSLGRLAKIQTKPSLMSEVEVPTSWFGWGMLLSTAFVTVCGKLIFDIDIWMCIVAVALSYLLAIVACRATGETDVTPIGPLGKITQLTYAGIRPGHYETNLMTACITAGSASHSADLLTDLKTGYLLGGSPRRQFVAQFLGIVAGTLFCVPAYLIVVRPEKLGTPDLPGPAAQTWAVVADLLAHGVETKERGPSHAQSTEIETVSITRRPPGATNGDALVILEGPNAGTYRIEALNRTSLLLDRDLEVAETQAPSRAEIRSQDGSVRGGAEVQVKPGVIKRPALRFVSVPDGTKIADYVRAEENGRDVYQRIEGLRGDLALLDHKFVATHGGTIPVLVKKMTLPPYAFAATLIAILFGVLVTLLELYGPKGLKTYLPSVTGLGIAWVIAAYDSFAMATGAIIVYILSKAAPKIEERYNVSTSSGIIAGASIMGLIIIFFRDILTVLQGP